MKRRALVTGAGGFIGSHMVDYLIKEGYKVRATDLPNAKKTYLNKEAEFLPSDLTKIEQIHPLLENIDVIFHVAAIYNFSCPREILYKVNVGGTENLLKAAKDFPKIQSIIIWSTGAFYDSRAYNLKDFPEMIFTEESPVKPKNYYELSKLEQEKIALKYAHKYGLPVTVIRPATVYGQRNQYGAAQVILLIGKKQLSFVPGKGDKPGATCHVLDVARAAEFLSKNQEAVGEIYNIADDSRYSIKELFYCIAAQIPGAKIRIHIPLFIISLLISCLEWIWINRAIAHLSKMKSSWARKIHGRIPEVEKDSIDYIFNPFVMDNQKIKALGFEFLYPDVKIGMEETIEWYLREKIW
ncbi:MAG: hypothetical protein COV69_01610 [Parcubacteria group bacterium CG11_big_fil_rev_8_21_14_0_20_39_14]|nr:MAG: hypothetical protein COV69_01610 [Parcubacteria group bacterium CG11_big_fil_rev_8_21_14_0_20_39_14]PIS35286.1 MAG: hypothetical protein COT36_03130 [Parcubacteria group bacterium CG08_land_8_20_14_0_20_38_56]